MQVRVGGREGLEFVPQSGESAESGIASAAMSGRGRGDGRVAWWVRG